MNKRSVVSLRLLDWLSTNYSKSHKISYPIGEKNFDMYLSYKAQLKGYSKNYFDPFQRKTRINFILNGSQVETTIGQLNFFKWAIQNKVIEYAHEHTFDIHKNMSESQERGTSGKRKLLTDNRNYTRTNFSVTMKF